MLMCLSSLGAILAEALQCTYARLCCRWPQYVHDDDDDGGGRGVGHREGDVSDDDDEEDEEHVDGLGQKPNGKRQHRQHRHAGRKDSVLGQHLPRHQCEYQDHHKHGVSFVAFFMK